MKNKIAELLIKGGTPYNKQRLHGKRYSQELLDSLKKVPESVKDLLRLSRGALEMFEATQKQLLRRLRADAQLYARLQRLEEIPGAGEATALT